MEIQATTSRDFQHLDSALPEGAPYDAFWKSSRSPPTPPLDHEHARVRAYIHTQIHTKSLTT